MLVIYYSQSGDVAQVAESFAEPLRRAGAETVLEPISSTADYPYPWKNLVRLYSVFPECVLGVAPEIHAPSFTPEDHFDLIVLAYPVWHLAPALPVQGFLRSEFARPMIGADVVTLCVSRNMWHSASETMKKMLADLGARHVDNAVVTHQGPGWATFVSVPRALLYGKRDRLWGIFPPAVIGDGDLARVARFGQAVADRLGHPHDPSDRAMLKGLGAVRVRIRSAFPEMIGFWVYRRGARLVLRAGRFGRWIRQVAILAFVLFMVVVIVLGIPLVVLAILILYPFLGRQMRRYATRLAEPSGS